MKYNLKEERKEVRRWWFFILLLFIISSIILISLNYIGIFGRTVVERKIFEQSYQKKAADQDAKTTYAAELARLRSRLNNTNLDANTRAEIQAQIDAINILKATKED